MKATTAFVLFLLEIGLITLATSFSTFAVVNKNPRRRRCNYDPSSHHQLYFASRVVDQGLSSPRKAGSDDNLAWLQECFNCTDEWVDRAASIINSVDRSILTTRLDFIKQRLKLSDEELAKMIQRCPRFLNLRHDTNVGPTLDFLAERLGIKTKSLSKIVRCNPSILGVGINETQTLQRNLDWIQTRLYLNETKDVAKVASNCPSLLYLSIDNNLEPKFNRLQERLSLNETEIVKMIVRSSTMIAQSFDSSLEPKLSWLQERLNLHQTELARIIRRHPTLLTCSSDVLESKLVWLQDRLSLDDETIRNMVTRQQPSILCYSTSMNMEPTIQWFEENFALKDHPCVVSKMFGKNAQLFCMSIPNNLEPTLRFFKECIGDEKAVKLLRKNPRFLTASLEKRLKPRLKQVQRLGIEVDVGCVQRMTLLTEDKWNTSLAYQQSRT